MVSMEMLKEHFIYNSNSYKKEKIFHQKLESFTFWAATDKFKLTG